MQQHHRQESARFRFRRHQLDQQPAEPNRLGAKVGANQALAGSRRIAFGEDQVDYSHHGLEPFREHPGRRQLVGNSRRANLALRADQPLRHRGGRGQKRARDLLGLEAAQRPEREGNARIVGQRGMTAGEDEAQALVAQFARVIVASARVIALGHADQLFATIIETRLAPDAIDRLMPRDGDNPRARIFRDTIAAPLLERSFERVLSGILRKREIAEHADKRGEDSSEILAIEALNFGGARVHRRVHVTARWRT